MWTTILILVGLLSTVATDTQTFQFESATAGRVTYSYPRDPASECVFDNRTGVLTCEDNQSYENVTNIWLQSPSSIKYLKMNGLLDSKTSQGDRQPHCFCSKHLKPYWPCNFTSLDQNVLVRLSNLEVIDLSHNEIQTVSPFAFKELQNLKYLSLSFNNIKELGHGVFCAAQSLQFLELNNLILRSFPYDSFVCKKNVKLNHLNVLHIKGSNLKEIPAKSLSYLPSLDTLHLQSNPIDSINKTSFSGGTSLVELDLTGCNINYLFPHFCDYLPRMTNLYLSDNKFTNFEFEELTNCASLKELNLSSNTLDSVSGIGVGLNYLLHLDLSDNNLHSVDSTFQGFTSLSDLYLHDNDIQEFTDDQFTGAPGLTYLNARNNNIGSSENFHVVFEKLPNLEYLDLGGNGLSDIRNNSFRSLANLRYLVLDSNNISRLALQTFSGLYALEELYLQHNIISSLEKGVFSDLSNMSIANFAYNSIVNISDKVLNDLPSLQSLTLSFNKLAYIGQQKWSLLGLLLLDNNDMTVLPPDINFESMRHFDVSHNKLESFFGVGDNLLANFENLVVLDVSYNNISDVSPGLFASFSNLEHLNMEHNSVMLQLSSTLFESAVNLTYLNLANNRVTLISALFSGNALVNLITLNLSSNILGDITLLSDTDAVSTITSIDMSNCSIQNLASDTFHGLGNLDFVDLSFNGIETFPPLIAGPDTHFNLKGNPLICACNMTWLREHAFEVKKGTTVVVDHFAVPKCKVYMESKAYRPQYLELRQFTCAETKNCDSKCDCYKRNPDGNISTIECRNNLNSVPLTISESATSIFLDGNSFTSETSLSVLSSLGQNMSARELYLNNSAITSMDPDIFVAFPELEILSLANNMIRVLPTGIFQANTGLRFLYLQNNTLLRIQQGVFNNLPSLKLLDLSGNRLSFLFSPTVTELSGLSSVKAFFFSRNPWACNCSNVNFKHFIDSIRPRIHDRRKLFCDTDRDMVAVDKSDFVCSVRDVNGTKVGMIVGIILGVIAFLLIVSILYYYRRELLSLLYYKTGCRIPRKPHVAGKHFDVFISYNPSDQNSTDYIQKTLLPRLKNNSYHVQTSNDVIQDLEVTKKMLEDSRCSLFVIDGNFATNTLMMQVFISATRLQKVHKQHNVILIILGDIDLMSLEPEVMSRMRKGDYITARSRLWWERLVYELPDQSGFRPRAMSDDDDDVVVFSSLAEEQYEQL